MMHKNIMLIYILILFFMHHVSHDTVNKQTNILILGEICAMCKKI